MRGFDAYYDPPEEPDMHPIEEEITGLLDECELPDGMRDKILELVGKLAAETLRECPVCAKARYEAEMRAEKEAQEYWASAAANNEVALGLWRESSLDS